MHSIFARKGAKNHFVSAWHLWLVEAFSPYFCKNKGAIMFFCYNFMLYNQNGSFKMFLIFLACTHDSVDCMHFFFQVSQKYTEWSMVQWNFWKSKNDRVENLTFSKAGDNNTQKNALKQSSMLKLNSGGEIVYKFYC